MESRSLQPEIEQFVRRKKSQRQGSSLLDPGLRVKSLAVSQAEVRPAENPFPDVLDIQHTGITQRLGLSDKEPCSGSWLNRFRFYFRATPMASRDFPAGYFYTPGGSRIQ